MTHPSTSLDYDIDALLCRIDTCTSHALDALEGAADIRSAQRWVTRIREMMFDYIIHAGADDDFD